jgi:hypothetical protein
VIPWQLRELECDVVSQALVRACDEDDLWGSHDVSPSSGRHEAFNTPTISMRL